MKYRLKDHELQRKLDAISDGDFSRQLQEYDVQLLLCYPPKRMVVVNFSGPFGDDDFLPSRLTFRCNESEIESVENGGRNKKGWMPYPEVTPPEGVLMRVECNQMKTCLVFENGKWRYPSGESFENYEFMFPVKRFRPWDDPDGEEDEE